MKTIATPKIYTFEECLALEKRENERYEFYNGEVFSMAGSSKRHNTIASNIKGLLGEKFNSKSCDVYQESIKVAVKNINAFMYPDVVVSCDEEDKKDPYFVHNPFLIVEVLSAGTENYDRSIKLHNYRKIKSLRYYLLVSQEKPMVEVFSRQEGNAIFSYNLFEDVNDILEFADDALVLALKDVYKGIEFTF